MADLSRTAKLYIAVAVIVVVLILGNTIFVFRGSSVQTMDTGKYRLESISGDLESTINDSRINALQLSLQAQRYLDDRQALEQFILESRDLMRSEDAGFFSIYIVAKGWNIVPDYANDDHVVLTQRDWYLGAIEADGEPYVTSPYVDLITGKVCYTVAVQVGESDAVLAMDFSADKIQKYVDQLDDEESDLAVILAEDGTIAGCSDEHYVGQSLTTAIPEYAGVYSVAKNNPGVATTRIKDGFFYRTLFASKTESGWYMIVSVTNWQMFRDSYLQIFSTGVICIVILVVIVGLYLLTIKMQKRAAKAVEAKEQFFKGMTGDLWEPLHRIRDNASPEHRGKIEDPEEVFENIYQAAGQLSEKVNQMVSYSSLLRKEEKEEKEEKLEKSRGLKGDPSNSKFRFFIILFLSLAMILSLILNINVSIHRGMLTMQKEVDSYEYLLSEWINTQKSTLDMFCSVISTNPEMIDDYDRTVAFLNRICEQYPEISVCYIVNPEWDVHTIMNNGYVPGDDIDITTRPWYVGCMESPQGWNISAPYYDEQTGVYCITFSEKVYDSKTGDYIGIFSIDFYMDKLISILGGSYSENGYAFLVDRDGYIVNHPYGKYQMADDVKVDVSELIYGEAATDGKKPLIFKDYDHITKVLIATKNDKSDFIVYVVSPFWRIYGTTVLYIAALVMIYAVCIFLVYRMLTGLIRWQEENNRKVQQAADMAVAAGKAKSQFLAQMSHEIRTPINAVLGMNEMILRESEEEETLEYANNIQTAGRTLLSLINSILDFSKIEDGKMEIIPVKYEIAELANNLVVYASERSKKKNLKLHVDVDETLPVTLYGDDVRITQVILNLLSNAVKYTESGEVSLTIRGEEASGYDIILYVEVKDTGIGIKEEDMDRLFESFERLDEKRNRHIEGTGLGMAIVVKLLKMMDSKLEVESVYGEGSTFSFRLRQQVVDNTPMGNYLDYITSHKQLIQEGKVLFAPEAKVLLVDDNAMNLKVAENLMKIYGFVPDRAESGFEAIEKVRETNYHIIFLDHMMPKMDGIETLHKMHEEKLISGQTAVIVLTANAIVGAKEMYLEEGFDDYLSKPMEVKELEQKLAGYLPEKLIQYRDESAAKKKKKEDKKKQTTKASTSTAAKTETSPKPTKAETKAGDEEVLEFAPEASAESSGNVTENVLKSLRDMKIDTEAGMGFCAEDAGFYMEMMGDYIESYQHREQELTKDFEQEDWEDYRIIVHALKGVSNTLGIHEVAEPAKKLEQAAAKGDSIYLKAHHYEMMKIYKDIVERLKLLIQPGKI